MNSGGLVYIAAGISFSVLFLGNLTYTREFMRQEKSGIFKGVIIMLGMADGWTAAVWILNVASMLLCVVYGVVNWNKDGEGW